VPEDRLTVPGDAEEIVIGDLRFLPVDTPGHAEHHYAYVFEDICFSGDVGGVRISKAPYLRVPMPPPELHLERWRASVQKLQTLGFKHIAPTHFGIFDDPEWQLKTMLESLDETARWLEEVMPAGPSVEELREMFTDWMEGQGSEVGLSEDVNESYRLANPLGMSGDGLYRYWRKFRAG
jgi:glyoxylase-like metal-dependent hydrolase (beta-lactamase superfamily II)